MLRAASALALLIGLVSIVPAASQVGDRVRIGPFAIDRTEVTVGQFRAFVSARGIVTAAEKEGGGFEYAAGWVRRPGWTWATPYGRPAADAEPVTHVSWFEARDYCIFSGGRLPTFAEWKQAAYTETRPAPPLPFEAGRTYPFPVGETGDGMNNSRRSHVAAGTTKAGVNGLFDMGGNVWEWLADRREHEAMTAGGSWWYGAETARVDGAQWKPAEFYVVYIGLRCVYDLNG